MKYDIPTEQRLMDHLLHPQIADNLANFVRFVYPWGQKGTPLEHHAGPRQWQLDELDEMTAHLAEQRARAALDLSPRMWRKATAAGRGVGKSAMIAWLAHWMMTTRIGSTTIITANTEPQLKTRGGFAEVSKWMAMAVNEHWFDCTVLSIKPAPWFAQIAKDDLKKATNYYYVSGQLYSEENPDAFAGAHNPCGMMLICEEASGFPTSIATVAEGFFTEPTIDRFWNMYSNPRRSSGFFFDCFHDEEARKRWKHRQIDRRTVDGQDPAEVEGAINQYGADSDKVRVEVYGQFPKQGDRQFISNEVARLAQTRELEPDGAAPLIIGVDIARYGDDSTVLRFRQGRDARSIPPVKIKNRDNMVVANTVAAWMDRTNPDAVNIDAGNGTGVIDRLREMKYRVNEVWFGGKSTSKEWANKRTEMYADLRDWLGGGAVDNDAALFRDLTAPEYDYFGKASDSVMLESKESMKNRGLPSPDDGDALALTFAVKVARRDLRASRSAVRNRIASGVDYDIFG